MIKNLFIHKSPFLFFVRVLFIGFLVGGNLSSLYGDQAALATAEALFDAERYNEALEVLVDITRQDPELEGLAALRNRIKEALLTRKDMDLLAPVPLAKQEMLLEARAHETLPDTYGVRKNIRGEQGSHIRPQNAVSLTLDKPISLHVQGADLSTIISAIAQDGSVNIISDQSLGAGKKIDVEVDNVPLREMLDYVSRNYAVEFHYGQNAIWAVARGEAPEVPMETRVYRLRKGIQFHGSDWGALPEGGTQTGVINNLSYKATVLATEKTYIEDVLERFVPMEEGAQMFFDRNTHALFVRNTPDNIRLVEQMVDTLDISPPQVFIEARFIEVRAADLREVGVDWLLESPLTVSKKMISENGFPQESARTVVGTGSSFSSVPFTSDTEGVFPLGPQGSFGATSAGNPPTANQGLNLKYRGILTEPMFEAVLHALEISGKGRTLSVPRVATVNNTPAKLRDGEDLLYFDEFEAQAFTLLDEAGKRVTLTALIPKGKPQKEELGITLVAVPSVGADMETISLLLTPTISRLLRFVSYQDESEAVTQESVNIDRVVVKLPVIARREVQTKVQVNSGETVVMGGLIDTVSQDTEHRIPILSSIPGLGKLFTRTDVTEERMNLLIFVTATVISERGESLIPISSTEP